MSVLPESGSVNEIEIVSWPKHSDALCTHSTIGHVFNQDVQHLHMRDTIITVIWRKLHLCEPSVSVCPLNHFRISQRAFPPVVVCVCVNF